MIAALIDQLGTDDALLAQARADLEDPSVSLRAVVRRLDMQSSATVSTNRRFPRLTVPTIERSGTQTRGSVAVYWGALLEANADRLVDPDLIMPGQMLTLPPLTAGS